MATENFLSVVQDDEETIDDVFSIGEEFGDDSDAEEPFVYSDFAANLVPIFMDHPRGHQVCREIADEVHQNFEDMKESNADFREKMARNWKLMAGDLPMKSFPFTNSANVHVPMMVEHMLQLTSRVESELFGDFSRVYGVIPFTKDHKDEAKTLEMHGNRQLTEEIPDFYRQMSRGLMSFFVFGDVTFHSFYNPQTKRNVHEMLTPDDFYTPYNHVTTLPDYGDLPHYAKILRYYRNQLEARIDEWHGVDELLDHTPPSWGDEPESLLRESVAETTGIEEPTDQRNAPYVLIHYEGWMDLPSQTRQRWVQVIMDYESKTLLKLVIHEEAEWRDKVRYDREISELEGFRANKEEYYRASGQFDLQQGKARAEMMNPALDDIPGARDELANMVDQMEAPRFPAQPTWMKDPDDPQEMPVEARMSPILMFSHGVCIENLAGSLGLSFGAQQADFNRAANTLVSQFVDSGTLANCWSLVVTESVEFDTPFEFAPGKVNVVSGISGSELKNNIMELKPAPGNPQMLQMANQIYEWAGKAAQAPSVLSGESGKSGETYRGLNSRIEQATKQIAVPARRFALGPLKQVLINNGRLNAKFLPESQMVQVTDPTTKEQVEVKVDRRMYARNYDVTIRADMRFTSEGQRIQEEMELVQLPQIVPQLQQNNSFIHAAVTRLLDARGDQEMIAHLGPPPDLPTTPFAIPPPPPPGMMGPEGQPLAPTPGGVPEGAAPGQAPPGPPIAAE